MDTEDPKHESCVTERLEPTVALAEVDKVELLIADLTERIDPAVVTDPVQDKEEPKKAEPFADRPEPSRVLPLVESNPPKTP